MRKQFSLVIDQQHFMVCIKNNKMKHEYNCN